VGIPHSLATGEDDIVRPAHASCNEKAGAELGAAITEYGRQQLQKELRSRNSDNDIEPKENKVEFFTQHSVVPALRDLVIRPTPESAGIEQPFDSDSPIINIPEPITPDFDNPVWDIAPWLDDLRAVPANATWPRLMSPPHSAAVGSHGPKVFRFAASRGIEFRWWQRLALMRLLEFDNDGHLVWVDALLSTARQVGKSVALRELALWRISPEGRACFGGLEQLVLHTAKDLAICREIQRPARIWARDFGWKTREQNGHEEIMSEAGDRWLIRAKSAVYGYASTLALVDEAWGCEPRIVEDGIEPTLTEQEFGQLIFFSTAHRYCSPLVPVRRAGMMRDFGNPEASSLLLEWSAPRDSDIDDIDGWRLASPHWTPGRQRLIEKKSRQALGRSDDPDEDDPVEGFKSQYLNIWRLRQITDNTAVEPLIDSDAWAHLTDLYAAPAEGIPLTVAVADYLGLRAAGAAACQLPDGRVLVWGGAFDSVQDAFSWASFTIGTRPNCRLLVGRSLSTREASEWCPRAEVSRVSTEITGQAFSLLRSLARAGRLAHSGDEALNRQAATVMLAPTASGALTQAHKGIRADFLHAAAWAVTDTAIPAEKPLDFYVY